MFRQSKLLHVGSCHGLGKVVAGHRLMLCRAFGFVSLQ